MGNDGGRAGLARAGRRTNRSSIIILGFAASSLVLCAGGALAGESSREPDGIAVVELFTSQACPSCPSADAFLKELASDARLNGRKIFTLAFHVDYWSPPSQRDPLSSQEFAERQKAYAEALGLDSVYTPQMIVNGSDQFIGSEREQGRRSIAQALLRPARVTVKVKAERHSEAKEPVVVDYELSSVPRGAVLNVAIVERSWSQQGTATVAAPQRQFDNVVRVFRTLDIKPGPHRVQLPLPVSARPANTFVIAYVQDRSSRAVLGASSVDVQVLPGRPQVSADDVHEDDTTQ